MQSIYQDLRISLRGLQRDRGSIVLAVAALALGIGATTSIFSVIQNVLLHPYPYADADRLFSVRVSDSALSDSYRDDYTLAEFLDYRAKNQAFDAVLATRYVDALYDTGEGLEQWRGAEVSANTFAVLGMAPVLGRGLEPRDGQPGAAPVFVMGFRLWNTEFGADPKIIGRQFVLNGASRTCVGVMPLRFNWNYGEVWLPAPLDRTQDDGARYTFTGRLKPGVPLSAANADFLAVAKQEALIFPKWYEKNLSISIEKIGLYGVQRFRLLLFVVFGSVCMLLLIACANVANLLLARGGARAREMAIRASLGASRGRLFRLTLTESALLALLAAVIGCILAYFGLKGLVAIMPRELIADEGAIGLDFATLRFSLVLACLTALFAGALPALEASKPDLSDALKDGARGASLRRSPLLNIVVVAEIALSLILLTGASLLVRSFLALQVTELGLDGENLLLARLPLPEKRYRVAADVQHFYQNLIPRLEALPGVISAAQTSALPIFGGFPTPTQIPGKEHSGNWVSQVQLVSAHYPKTLGLHLLRGRCLSETEVDHARHAAMVNSQLVHAFFGNEDPIGRHIRANILEVLPYDAVKDPDFEIVGVYAGSKNRGLRDPPQPEILVPYTLSAFSGRCLVVRTTNDPARLLNSLRREVHAVDPNVAVASPAGGVRYFLNRYALQQPRLGMVLVTVFAAIGLVLVATGIYSVMAFSVTARTHEIGIRMAVGAQETQVLSNVLTRGMRLIALGALLGVAASFATARIFASQVFGISANDPLSLAGAVAVVILAGVAACYFPARKATRVDPLVALRHE